MKEITYKNLKRFNIIIGSLHFVQAVLMLILSLSWSNIKEYTPTIWSYFLQFNQSSARLETNPQALFELPFGILVSMFLFISALAHFTVSIPRKTNYIYNKDLENGINKFRWYEYGLSSSFMIVLIAVLFGVYDIGALILIFLLNASMNFFGLLMEKINMKKKGNYF